jgi:positive regulator of sigma E activity
MAVTTPAPSFCGACCAQTSGLAVREKLIARRTSSAVEVAADEPLVATFTVIALLATLTLNGVFAPATT